MKSHKIISALFTLTLLLTALIAVQAQTKDAGEWKQQVKERIIAGIGVQNTAQTEAAKETKEAAEKSAETAEAKTSDTQSTESAESNTRQNTLGTIFTRRQNALIGTWDLTLTFGDGSKVKSTLTVIPGRRDGEGSVIHAAEASLLKPSPTTPEQGAWRNQGGLQFIASYVGYAVDENLEKPAGKIGFRHSILLNHDEESFHGNAVFEVRDTDGKVVFSDNIKTEGTRQKAVAP